MYTRLGGFWSTMVHGSLDAGKVAVAATATGGNPAAAAAAGGLTAAKEVKGSGSGSSGSKAGTSGVANWLDGLSNTQLALFAAGSAALVTSLMGGRR
jgi:hypothetical protein